MSKARTEIHLHHTVTYGFHITYFHKTKNSTMAVVKIRYT